MASTSETGHAKNVAIFGTLISFVNGYGKNYNPSNSAIALTALQTLSSGAKVAINAVDDALIMSKKAVAARKVAFKPLNKFVTRALNALRSSGVTEEEIANARTLSRKIQGMRASKKKNEKTAEGESSKEISDSQQSFDLRLSNLNTFVKLLSGNALYVPNETDLKAESLTDMYNKLDSDNNAVVAAETALSNARIARNRVIYGKGSGVCDIATQIKSYVKSIYGAESPEFKQVSKLQFRTSDE